MTVHSLGKTLLAFVLLHFVLQGQTCLLLQVSLDFLLCIPIPMMNRTSFFFFFSVLVPEDLVENMESAITRMKQLDVEKGKEKEHDRCQSLLVIFKKSR